MINPDEHIGISKADYDRLRLEDQKTVGCPCTENTICRGHYIVYCLTSPDSESFRQEY